MLRAPKDPKRHHGQPVVLKLAFAVATVAIVLCPLVDLAHADDPPPNNPPMIEWFAISEGPGWTFEFFGYVSDQDNSTEGYKVQFGGIVSGIEATVGPDGSFDEIFYLPGIQSGLVTADTKDPQGASAETAAYDLLVTPP